MTGTEELNLDDFDLDNELDFDFNNTDVESSANPDITSGKRKVVEDTFKGAISGAKNTVTDSGFIKNFIVDSLPKEYGMIIDETDKATSTLSSLYDESIKELKPKLNTLSTKVKRLIPEKNVKLKKIVSDIADSTADREKATAQESRETVEERSIQQSLQDVFEANKSEEKERIFSEAKEHKKFKINTEQFTRMSKSLDTLTQYTTGVTSAFQKKSLELQYRSYFAQKELLKTTSRHFEIFNKQNEAVVKNTALPEFIKTRNSEVFKQQLKERTSSGIQDSLLGEGSLIDNLTKGVKEQGKGIIDGISSSLDAAMFGLDAAELSSELEEALGEKKSGANKLGSIIADMTVGGVAKKVSGKIRESISDDSNISKKGFDTYRYLRDPELLREKLQESELYKNAEFGTVKDAGLNILNDLLRSPGMTGMDTQAAPQDSIQQAGVFTNKTNRSITDIIPGYLSRILREVASIRSGKDESLLMYNYGRGSFDTKDIASASLANKLRDATRGDVSLNVNKTLQGIHNEPLRNSNKEEQDVLLEAIMKGGSSSPERLIKNLRTIGSPAALELVTILEKNVINSNNTSRSNKQLSDNILSTKSSLPKIDKVISSYVDQGYGDILEEQGVITRRDDGGYSIDPGKYRDVVLEKGNSTQSPTSKPSEVFNRARNKRTSSIQTPTVSDTKTDEIFSNNFDVTSIVAQLTTANTSLTSVTEHTNILPDLNTTINDIHELLKKGINYNVVNDGSVQEPGSTGSSNVNDTLRNLGTFTSKSLEALFTTGKGLGKGITDSIAKVTESLTDDDGFLRTTLTDITKNSLGLASSVISKGSEVLTSLFGTGKGLVGKGISIAKKTYNALLDYTGDIYIEGVDAPVLRSNLMKLGIYIDQKTGKAIKSIKDITGPVIDRDGNTILTLDDLGKGLFDKTGERIKTANEQLMQFIKNQATKGIDRAKKAASFVKETATDIFTSIKEKKTVKDGGSGFDIGLSSGKSYNVLVEIRDILKKRLGGGDNLSDMDSGEDRPENTTNVNEQSAADIDINQRYRSGRPLDFKGLIPDKVKAIKDRLGKASNSKIAGDLKDKIANKAKGSKTVTNITGIKDTVKDAIGSMFKSKTFNDRDGSGTRDGSVEDRLKKEEEREKARNKGFQEADLEERYRGENFLDVLTSKIGSLFDKADDMFDDFDTDGPGKRRRKGRRTKGSRAKGLKGSIKNMASKAGNAFKSGGSRIANAAKTAKAGGTKLGGMLAGGLKAAGGLASTLGAASLSGISTGLSIAGSAIGSIAAGAATTAASVISSPVVLGTAAIALTAYGGYKTYKYFTRNSTNEFDDIRITQYGLTLTDADKHHIHELLELEAYLADGKIGFNEDKAYILKDKIDMFEIYDIFGIDDEDEERIVLLTTFMKERFLPFFLTHRTALFSVDRKASMDEIEDLDDIDKSRYLSAASFESGPYDVTASPFSDISVLPNTSLLSKSKTSIALDIVGGVLRGKFSPSNVKTVVKDSMDKKNDPKNSGINNTMGKITDDVKKKTQVVQQRYNQPTGNKKPNIISKNTEAVKSKLSPTPAFTGEEVTVSRQPTVGNTSSVDQAISSSKIPAAGGKLKTGENGFSYIKANSKVDFSGVKPKLMANLKGMAEEYGEKTGKSIHVNSAYRSTEKQAMLYRQNPRKAARPGRSLHEFGLAIDMNTVDANALDKLGLMRKYGFTRPVGGETWHTEPAGIQPYIKEAKTNPALADSLIDASIGSGGGGYATLSGNRKHRRNTKYAKSILQPGVSKKLEDAKNGDNESLPVKTAIASSTAANDSVMSPSAPVSAAPGSNDKSTADAVKPIINPLDKANIVPKPNGIGELIKKDKTKDLPDIENKPAAASTKPVVVKDSPAIAKKKVAQDLQLPVMASKPRVIEEGQGLSITPVVTGLDAVNTTLSSSLSVQQDILNAIQLIVDNTDPGKLKLAQENINKPARPTNTSRAAEPALKLKRNKA